MGVAEKTGVYSNEEIIEAHVSGHIVIEPFQLSQVNGSSYDVRLGEFFYTINEKKGLKSTVFNPYDPEHIPVHFEGYHRAKLLGEVVTDLAIKQPLNLDPETRVILLQPQQRILGHTQEFIGIKPPGTTSMQARSTVGRLGINVCQDAGWGDPGYINRWTMEIYNNNTLDPVLLAVGTRIAQIVFMHTGAVSGEYADLSGNYQAVSADDFEALQDNWQPESMLPKPLNLT